MYLKAILTAVALTFATGMQQPSAGEENDTQALSWPQTFDEYCPSTPGWKRMNERRFKQIAASDIEDDDRWEAYLFSLHSAMSKNFTEYGWSLTKAPQSITDKLKKRLDAGLKKRNEQVGVEGTFFIPDDEENAEILQELLPLHEAWSGVKLVPQNSYGLRVYRGNITLPMHMDETATHVISSILHVGHGEDDEPWALVIEDFHGNTNEVFLESGDMLFYESSKLLHGRPKMFNGDYYSSLFTHFSPDLAETDWYVNRNWVQWYVPDNYEERQEKEAGDSFDDLIYDDSDHTEPSCAHGWCGYRDSLKWHGPAPGYGKLLTGDGKVRDLNDIPSENSFRDMRAMGSGARREKDVVVEGMDYF